MTEIDEYLETARNAVRAASDLLAHARPQDLRGKTNPRDLVTEWDLRSEELIRQILGERAPGIAILGEEGGQSGDAAAGAPRWLVDPIDGTVNFAHGLPIWSISIALEQAGQVLAGVVAAPLLGWWFEASRGGGARDRSGAPLAVSAVTQLEQALLTTGFPYDLATHPINNFAEWEHLQRRAGACRRLGCASLDLCVVAAGWLEGYWERRVKPWDIGAGALIVVEAGGTVTNTTGGAFDPHAGEVVATNGAIHGELIAELAAVERARHKDPS
ncbi:MAG TPA: inositol monophosphatase family protein [Kofleriaceae bacterium]|nr:inositol monophosphatase family protein [Kofleriaceae bacterium]